MKNKSLGDKIVIIFGLIVFCFFISLIVVNEFNIVEEKIKNYLGWIFWIFFIIWCFLAMILDDGDDYSHY